MIKYLLITSCIFLVSKTSKAQNETENVNNLLNAWHKAAATADEDFFFGTMAEDGIYLGTDKTEKWTRDEMREWAKEYFERESAWSFEATSRDVYFSADGKTAWFNEKLNTWMGICKGTGVLVKQKGKWKIALYDLSVTIDNDKIQEFVKLIEK
ncbi:hypothetical protein GCM10011506_07930 [Marivirga lumbricoides]|uniref:SnoaL-like domain-containing protein n=1 Tax=Marivirga lumbricoides TaxID=1046115 RepID=A0ABQ1LN39_9BACT|nr:hypothetical protein GCM10011506_07930 [Marivirga lumbricoides]